MDEFPLDLIPLDHDLLSLEMPFCFKQFFLVGAQPAITCLKLIETLEQGVKYLQS